MKNNLGTSIDIYDGDYESQADRLRSTLSRVEAGKGPGF